MLFVLVKISIKKLLIAPEGIEIAAQASRLKNQRRS